MVGAEVVSVILSHWLPTDCEFGKYINHNLQESLNDDRKGTLKVEIAFIFKCKCWEEFK